jgi:hypothetical protein
MEAVRCCFFLMRLLRDAVQITYGFGPPYFALTALKNHFRSYGYAKDF